MRFSPAAKVTRIEDVAPGELFLIEEERELYYAIACRLAQQDIVGLIIGGSGELPPFTFKYQPKSYECVSFGKVEFIANSKKNFKYGSSGRPGELLFCEKGKYILGEWYRASARSQAGYHLDIDTFEVVGEPRSFVRLESYQLATEGSSDADHPFVFDLFARDPSAR